MKKVLLGIALAMGLAFGVLPEDVKECFKGVSCPGGKPDHGVLPLDLAELSEYDAERCLNDKTGEVCYKAGRGEMRYGSAVITIYTDTNKFARQFLYLDRACDLNYAPGCIALSVLYLNRKMYAFPKHALEVSKKVCDLNDGDGCKAVGNVYDNSFGTTPKELIDYKKAVEFFKKGCDLNDGGACNNLGFAYAVGRGVKTNETQAKKFFQKSCKLGQKDGCTSLKNYTKSLKKKGKQK